MQKNAINCDKKANVGNCTADEMNLVATMHNRQKWCHKIYATETRQDLIEDQEVEMDVLVKVSMKLKEQLYLADINHECFKSIECKEFKK